MPSATRYPYQEERHQLFDTERGQKALAWGVYVASRMHEFSMPRFHSELSKFAGCQQIWTVLNLLDYMVEIGAIREFTGPDTIGQNRAFQFNVSV